MSLIKVVNEDRSSKYFINTAYIRAITQEDRYTSIDYGASYSIDVVESADRVSEAFESDLPLTLTLYKAKRGNINHLSGV